MSRWTCEILSQSERTMHAWRNDLRRIVIFVTALFLILSNANQQGLSLEPVAPVTYERDIKPFLRARCYACHGALKQAAGLRLDTGEFLRQGGDSGLVVKPKDPGQSEIVARVQSNDLATRMPPEGEPLTGDQIEALKIWIALGANSPIDEKPEADPRAHWSFQPVRGKPHPGQAVETAGNPIDSFIHHELKRQQMVARPQAAKAVQLRRVYLDLIGLPPTVDELRDFVTDDSHSAYERVVDRLLQDPRHGERWARHWMDVWRYSDWYGRRDSNDVRNSASQIFRWRDWIVRSLNEGKGYDRMLQEMLAADEICPDDYDAGVATGFLIRNYYSLNANDWMRGIVEHTGKAFLGLTFNCAHCHDHKYDPIEQDDYFKFRAFFEPIYVRQDRVAGESDPGMFQDYTYAGSRTVQRLGAVRIFDKQPDATTWFYTGGDERNRVKDRGSIAPGVPAFLTFGSLRIDPVELPPSAWYPGLRSDIQQTILDEVSQNLNTAEQALAKLPRVDEEKEKPQSLIAAEASLKLALEQSEKSGELGPLAGKQSLLIDASKGRRLLQNGLTRLTKLEDGAKIEFLLTILEDSHFNFQLISDITQGLTASFVGFEKGKILSYKPGGHSEFQAGAFHLATGQSRFQVTIKLLDKETCSLTVHSLRDNCVLVDNLPIARNGWNPVGDPKQVIAMDARTGCVAAVDDIRLTAGLPSHDALVVDNQHFDFELPQYATNSEVVGIDGWGNTTYSQSPSTSIIVQSLGNSQLREARSKLDYAMRHAHPELLRRKSAELKVVAFRAELASLMARIAADRAKFQGNDSGSDEKAKSACFAEREFKLKKAESDLISNQVLLLDAELRSDTDAKRMPALDSANKAIASAQDALQAAQRELASPLNAEYSPLSPQYPKHSTGRRRALAEWITSPDNPLTARVAANHIWTRHFQTPIVSSMYDFGRNGALPTHPELLDWLACELIGSGWNMKHLHRLIVTSQTYRRVSSVGNLTANAQRDPENKLLWRMNSSRMESEVLRDSLLYLAGRLDTSVGGVEKENTEALTTTRRSLYYSSYPEAGGKSPLGELFDAPDPLECYRRVSSIVPQQALALTNSELVDQTSAALVARWVQSNPELSLVSHENEKLFIHNMFEQVLARPPTDAELVVCRDVLREQTQLADSKSNNAVHQAMCSLARVLLNHNDFLTVR
jgi:Protein of unknown function (DUF1553)/Protein of unknown function (DUF1549)/Planctomycete cytochrome C